MSKKKTSPRRKKTAAFVLDGSTALAWCFADETSAYADAVARKLPNVAAVVPAIWHLEVTNAMMVGERRGRCDRRDTAKWMAYLSSLSITGDEQGSGRILDQVVDLARTHKLSTYDAAYVELALRRGLPLASLDEPLKNAAVGAGVLLFDPSA